MTAAAFLHDSPPALPCGHRVGIAPGPEPWIVSSPSHRSTQMSQPIRFCAPRTDAFAPEARGGTEGTRGRSLASVNSTSQRQALSARS